MAGRNRVPSPATGKTAFLTLNQLSCPAVEGPAPDPVIDPRKSVAVEGEDYTFRCPPDTVLLDAMLDNGAGGIHAIQAWKPGGVTRASFLR